MAMRSRFGINCTKLNWGRMSELLPIGYQEVAPGETISGKVSVDVQSAPTIREIKTRAYLDAFLLYVPFRLLWSQWTNFVSSGSTPTCPTVANLFPKNFERRFTIGAGNGDSNNAFQRRAYNRVWVDHFNVGGTDPSIDTGLDGAVILSVNQRPSTFEVAEPPSDIASETIDTSGATITVDDIREATGS